MNYILRRKGVGKKSTAGVAKFSKLGLKVVRNDQFQQEEQANTVIRWGCNDKFDAKKTINKAKAISKVNDKYQSRKTILEAGLLAPALYDEQISFPCVVRKYKHAQGKDFYYCEDSDQLKEALDQLGEDVYISEYIDKDKEFGIFFFNNRIWSVVEKVPRSEEASNAKVWNVNLGTHVYENVNWSEWPINACKLVLDAVKLFDIDFGRADILEKNGKYYILEINSAHTIKSDYRQERFANCLDYYIEKGPVKNDIDMNNVVSYKSIIHPALRENLQGLNL